MAAQTVVVAVAASSQPFVSEIKSAMAGNIDVQIISGSSGKLSAQIKEGAPFDVFVSADTKYPDDLYRQGFCEKPKVYGVGTLVAWTLNNNLKLDETLSILKSNTVAKIAIANPKVAPYGQAAEEALKNLGIYNDVKEKLVFGESVAQTNQYIESRSADIGLTSKSTVLSNEAAGKGKWVEVIKGSYKNIAQSAAILKHGRDTNAASARAFFDFLFSENGKTILRKYGYLIQ